MGYWNTRFILLFSPESVFVTNITETIKQIFIKFFYNRSDMTQTTVWDILEMFRKTTSIQDGFRFLSWVWGGRIPVCATLWKKTDRMNGFSWNFPDRSNMPQGTIGSIWWRSMRLDGQFHDPQFKCGGGVHSRNAPFYPFSCPSLWLCWRHHIIAQSSEKSRMMWVLSIAK